MDQPRPDARNFEIRLRGNPGERLVSAFPELVAVADGGDTVLAGRVPDQAAMHGVLARVEMLGPELVAVRRWRPST